MLKPQLPGDWEVVGSSIIDKKILIFSTQENIFWYCSLSKLLLSLPVFMQNIALWSIVVIFKVLCPQLKWDKNEFFGLNVKIDPPTVEK